MKKFILLLAITITVLVTSKMAKAQTHQDSLKKSPQLFTVQPFPIEFAQSWLSSLQLLKDNIIYIPKDKMSSDTKIQNQAALDYQIDWLQQHIIPYAEPKIDSAKKIKKH